MIMVIMVHYQQSFGICKWFHFFQMGCPIFFVASGFGIICLINKKYGGELNNKNVNHFYFSRFKALAPGWYMAVAIVFVANTIVLLIFGKTLNFGTNRNPISILCNLLFLHGLLPFCNNNVMPGGWYIGTTVILYALTPLILFGLKRFESRRLFFVLSSAALMLLWMVAVFALKKGSNNSFAYFFFPVHYPEYLLGILLHFDVSQSILNEKQIKLCLPLGILSFVTAYALFYIPITVAVYFSAWMTALGAYLILYYLISKESKDDISFSKFGKMLMSFGKNSYCIYLLHAFYAYTFIQILDMIFTRLGINLHTYFWLFVLIPVVLALSYFSGLILSRIIARVMSLTASKKKQSLA